MSDAEQAGRLRDPRGVRVTAAPAGEAELAPVVLEPPAVPLAPAPRSSGVGVLGGFARPTPADQPPASSIVLVDGSPRAARLVRVDPLHADLVLEDHTGDPGVATARQRVVLLAPPDELGAPPGVRRREVLVGGWRIVVDIESERRAALRERARRGREDAAHAGPLEVRAIIPGVVAAVSVGPGDDVVAGQQLLVVEAMKMQNELRSPRDGRIVRVAVAPRQTIEVGSLLLVIE